jgi:Protein of unknown function (DUF2911)
MKKTTIITTLLFVATLVFSMNAEAQKFPKMDVSPMDAASYPDDYRNSDKLIKITYSRPQLKGRELSSLTPNGKVWRTGANEATELTLYVDMKLGDTMIKAGTYTFCTIPGDSEWTAIINKDLNVWGSYFYNEANDLVRLNVPVTSSEDFVEAFSIVFEESDNGVDMHLGWGNARVKVPFTK